MFQDYRVYGNTCDACKATLVRVPQSVYPITEFAPDDAIVCVDCGAAGSHHGVIKQGDGLAGGILTKKQCVEITEALKVA
jgi:hypothetical protein